VAGEQKAAGVGRRAGAGHSGGGGAVGPRGRGGGGKRKKRKKKKREKRKRRKGEREGEKERAGFAASPALGRPRATRGSREKQGAVYGCRVRSFGDRKIGTGRFRKVRVRVLRGSQAHRQRKEF
jgi:hypothetical protein